MAGLTEAGLEILRFPEVLEELEADERILVDPNVNTQDDELLGQLNSIISATHADLWALAEAVNDNFNPLKAEGKNLDDIAAIIGITRNDATQSTTVDQMYVGDEGTNVPTGTILENTNTLERFLSTSTVSVTRGLCYEATFEVDPAVVPLDNTNFGLSVDGVVYDYLSDGTATEAEIIQGVHDLIVADGTKTWTSSIDLDNLLINVITDDLDISITTVVNMVTTTVSSRGLAVSQLSGAISAPSSSVDNIVVPISGVDTTYNLTAYALGSEVESDEDLRDRILVSQQTSGAATVPAIEDAIANLDSVESVSIEENRSFITDIYGRPPKSFETFVQGGDNQEIAQTIWDKKPAGIETYGDITVQVDDSTGDPQDILFSRPSVVNIAFQITYSLYTEEDLPESVESLASGAVYDECNGLGVDVDSIPSRYYGPIYNDTAGLEITSIETQVLTNSGDAPVGGSWSTAKIAIGTEGFAGTELVDIYYVVV